MYTIGSISLLYAILIDIVRPAPEQPEVPQRGRQSPPNGSPIETWRTSSHGTEGSAYVSFP